MSSLTPRLDRLEKNVVINGNFDFWQRGTSFSGITSNAQYFADRFNYTRGAAITGLVNTISQSTDVPTVAQSGFQSSFSLLTTNTAAATNLATSANIVAPTYHVEGYDLTKLVGRTVNLSFWVKCSVAGTYSMAFSRQFTDSYVTTYVINSANTWEKKSINIYIDPAVSWSTNSGLTNGRGIILLWILGAGTANTTSSLNQWNIANGGLNANTATNTFATTNGATFYLSQVMLGDSSQALQSFNRCGLNIQQEQTMCLRYAWRATYNSGSTTVHGLAFDGTNVLGTVPFPVPMRANPTMPTVTSVGQVRAGNSDITPTSLSFVASNPWSAYIEMTKTSSFSQTVSYQMYSFDITFDAEL